MGAFCRETHLEICGINEVEPAGRNTEPGKQGRIWTSGLPGLPFRIGRLQCLWGHINKQETVFITDDYQYKLVSIETLSCFPHRYFLFLPLPKCLRSLFHLFLLWDARRRELGYRRDRFRIRRTKKEQ